MSPMTAELKRFLLGGKPTETRQKTMEKLNLMEVERKCWRCDGHGRYVTLRPKPKGDTA